ncbi:hypothetical protein PQS31_03390 [Luteimonas sp BLCC-B24]|uniref:hypothetical protein n=1 Tax=Luteimonas sp. BLCC-B24 TaxID=3025317 RepID=UPI00234E29F8|nr:hypothetical protein [Luteimonas sp. BLCC-B24]MDC7805864.1 hypothetical protein [Luteimonas sp. BLCC-B24]
MAYQAICMDDAPGGAPGRAIWGVSRRSATRAMRCDRRSGATRGVTRALHEVLCAANEHDAVRERRASRRTPADADGHRKRDGLSADGVHPTHPAGP